MAILLTGTDCTFGIERLRGLAPVNDPPRSQFDAEEEIHGAKEEVDGVHQAGYDKIVTEFVPKYGHVLYMSPGYPEADALITPALDAVWVGDKTAEAAMKAVVPQANAVLKAAKG